LKPGLLDVRPSHRRGLKRDHDNPGFQLLEGPRVLLQLQQVPAAGQSTQVAMKYHQQPGAFVVFKAVNAALGIWQGKGNRWLTD
jgi:hypothetical protein